MEQNIFQMSIEKNNQKKLHGEDLFPNGNDNNQPIYLKIK
jgi:hypothetical protein